MDGGRIVYFVRTIAQAPVLIVSLLHETGAFFFQNYVVTTIEILLINLIK